MSNDNRATYRYTAEEQQELDSFRQKYATAASEDSLSVMRSIDRHVVRRATKRAVAIGLAGTLVMGAGLSMVLAFNWMIPGIVVGCAGIAAMASMPAFYEWLLKRERQAAAPQIRALLDKTE